MRGSEQIGTLVDYRADQQTAIRCALDRQLIGPRHAPCLEVLARRDEVVEHILLVGEAPGIVPRLAVLAAAADVGDRIDPASLDPRQPGWRKARHRRNVEPAIGIEDGRRRPVGPRFPHDEHRNLSSVF